MARHLSWVKPVLHLGNTDSTWAWRNARDVTLELFELCRDINVTLITCNGSFDVFKAQYCHYETHKMSHGILTDCVCRSRIWDRLLESIHPSNALSVFIHEFPKSENMSSILN